MKKNDFLLFLGLEVAAVIVAILLFKSLEPKKVAGFFAGAQFIALGLFLIFKILKSSSPLKFFTFYAAWIHLGCSLFLWGTRLVYWKKDFENLILLGLPMQTFHSFSEKFFMILILASLADFIRLQLRSAE